MKTQEKPRFRLSYYPPHSHHGRRYFADPMNLAADKLIKQRDAGQIPDFPLVIYIDKLFVFNP